MENEIIVNNDQDMLEPAIPEIPIDDVPVDPMIAGDSTIIPDDTLGVGTAVPVIPEGDSISRGCFFGTLQESVSIVWRYHLKTKKYSTHMTLNEFYTEALEIVDDIIERYQGAFSVIKEPYTNCIISEGKTEVEYLNELKDFIKKNTPMVICDNSDIQSRVDDFVGLINSTIYKLSSFYEHNIKSYDEFCYENLNEACSYDRFGERTCDDPDDPDFNEAEEE